MRSTTAHSMLRALHYHRPVPVAVSLGRKCRQALFDTFHGLLGPRTPQVIDCLKHLGILDTVRSSDACQDTQTQIPIALSRESTTVHHPAVSSLEASQTPAR